MSLPERECFKTDLHVVSSEAVASNVSNVLKTDTKHGGINPSNRREVRISARRGETYISAPLSKFRQLIEEVERYGTIAKEQSNSLAQIEE